MRNNGKSRVRERQTTALKRKRQSLKKWQEKLVLEKLQDEEKEAVQRKIALCNKEIARLEEKLGLES